MFQIPHVGFCECHTGRKSCPTLEHIQQRCKRHSNGWNERGSPGAPEHLGEMWLETASAELGRAEGAATGPFRRKLSTRGPGGPRPWWRLGFGSSSNKSWGSKEPMINPVVTAPALSLVLSPICLPWFSTLQPCFYSLLQQEWEFLL